MSEQFIEAIELQREKLELPDAIAALFEQWPQQDYAKVCAMAAHTLHHHDAPASQWQPWLALAAWGYMLQANIAMARSLALLSAVYPSIAKQLPTTVPSSNIIEHHALTYVLGLSPTSEPPTIPDENRMELIKEGFDSLTQEDCYALISHAIVNSDWELCLSSFDQLAELVLEGIQRDNWNAETRPGYEPAPAALAAFARSKGFPILELSEEAKGWLWPAVESEASVKPVSWPFH